MTQYIVINSDNEYNEQTDIYSYNQIENGYEYFATVKNKNVALWLVTVLNEYTKKGD